MKNLKFKIMNINQFLNSNLKKYNFIYLFPNNFQSRLIKEKFKHNNKIICVDNYSSNINKEIIKPEKIEDTKDNLLIITDPIHKKNFKTKLVYLKKKVLKLTDPNQNISKINLDKLKVKANTISKLFQKFNTDKGKYYKRFNITEKSHNYGKFYSKHFAKFRNKKINILEIGTYNGSSTAAFFFYFKKANLYGIDINKHFYKSKRLNFIKLDYLDKNKVQLFKKKYNNFFDIIIDDGSHLKSHIVKNFKNFFKCLKNMTPSYYVVEDYDMDFAHFNDHKNEFNFKKIIQHLKKKKFFKSKILNKNDQYLFNASINRIDVYKGDYIKNKKNISKIAFFQIKK